MEADPVSAYPMVQKRLLLLISFGWRFGGGSTAFPWGKGEGAPANTEEESRRLLLVNQATPGARLYHLQNNKCFPF